MLFAVVLIGSGVAREVVVADTNSNESGWYNFSQIVREPKRPQAIDRAKGEAEEKAARESYPCFTNPAPSAIPFAQHHGTWGPVNFGFQLSVNCLSNAYVSGGPIPVVATFRNVSTNYLRVSDLSQDSAVDYHPEDLLGHPVPYQPDHGLGGASVYGPLVMGPGQQLDYHYDLATKFAFQPGDYVVSGIRWGILGVPEAAGATSGCCRIKIIARPK